MVYSTNWSLSTFVRTEIRRGPCPDQALCPDHILCLIHDLPLFLQPIRPNQAGLIKDHSPPDVKSQSVRLSPNRTACSTDGSQPDKPEDLAFEDDGKQGDVVEEKGRVLWSTRLSSVNVMSLAIPSTQTRMSLSFRGIPL